jgi:hypothetical protein
MLRDPFPVTQPLTFGADARTRVMLFAENVTLLPGENISALTADAVDLSNNHYPLAVERVDPVPGFAWMSSVVVRLNDQLTDSTGDILITITLHGLASNAARVSLGSSAQPNLGVGARLNGKPATALLLVSPPRSYWSSSSSPARGRVCGSGSRPTPRLSKLSTALKSMKNSPCVW